MREDEREEEDEEEMKRDGHFTVTTIYSCSGPSCFIAQSLMAEYSVLSFHKPYPSVM